MTPRMRLLAAPIVVALAMTAMGCIDDSSSPPPLPLPDGAIPPVPTSTSTVPPDGAPPPRDASAMGSSLANTTAGGVVTKSESYRLVTRTGGSPASGTPGASESFKTKPSLPGNNKP